MCGIAGQVNFEHGRPVDPDVLRRMTDVVRHRGPDSEGFYLRGQAGLAMRRLAVIDLVTGEQPIQNEDGSIWVVFNGEIYNFAELRRELTRRGHTFRTLTDTEVIVHSYEEHGTACVERLRGMFAFALWDENRRRLLLARDRLGEKPLYYAEHDGALLFGSEVKCLLKYPGFPRRINFDALDEYLSLQYVPDPMSAFDGIQKLPPAHRLVWEDGTARVERYWNLSYEPKLPSETPELAAELRYRLGEAVRLRLVSDVPLGVHLSGGIDSSIVAALAATMTERPLKTFSVGFEEERFSELPFARTVAQRYGTEHHEFVLRFDDVPGLVGRLARLFDEPFADPSAIPVYLLARRTREHVTVALNGDGGDELFAGYVRYRLDAVADAYGRMPRALTQRIVPAILSPLPHLVNRPGEQNWSAGLRRLQQAACTTRKANFLRWGSYFADPLKQLLWKPEIAGALLASKRQTAERLADVYDGAPALDPLDRTLYVDSTAYLPGDLLVKADRMTMAHSLEARSPFLDHELQSWAARLPAHYKLNGRVHKYLLKHACADLLPPEVVNRGKQGFGIPLGAWLKGPLRGWIEQALVSPGARTHAYLNSAMVSHLVDEHVDGRANHANRLWALTMLELWLQEHM